MTLVIVTCNLQEEMVKRIGELRKMRDLLFYHEVKAKRVSKIKSKAYRKVHNKCRSSNAKRATCNV